jgi:hypothetical protein
LTATFAALWQNQAFRDHVSQPYGKTDKNIFDVTVTVEFVVSGKSKLRLYKAALHF